MVLFQRRLRQKLGGDLWGGIGLRMNVECVRVWEDCCVKSVVEQDIDDSIACNIVDVRKYLL
jgi:hypothetical protein